MFNAFADKDENPELPGSDWDLNFSEQNGTTKVSITIYNESLDRMEKMIEMGFKEGFTMTWKTWKNYWQVYRKSMTNVFKKLKMFRLVSEILRETKDGNEKGT